MAQHFRILIIAAFVSLLLTHAEAKTKPAKPKFDSVYGTELPVLKGSMIEIKSYDPETRTYTAGSPDFPGEGAHLISPEALKLAIDSFDYERTIKSPNSLIGVQFQLDRDLPRLFKPEKDLRRQPKTRGTINPRRKSS